MTRCVVQLRMLQIVTSVAPAAEPSVSASRSRPVSSAFSTNAVPRSESESHSTTSYPAPTAMPIASVEMKTPTCCATVAVSAGSVSTPSLTRQT